MSKLSERRVVDLTLPALFPTGLGLAVRGDAESFDSSGKALGISFGDFDELVNRENARLSAKSYNLRAHLLQPQCAIDFFMQACGNGGGHTSRRVEPVRRSSIETLQTEFFDGWDVGEPTHASTTANGEHAQFSCFNVRQTDAWVKGKVDLTSKKVL